MRHGANIRISLTDGTTLEGVLRFSWGWWSYKIEKPVLHTQHGSVPADGHFVVPRHSILHIQVVSE